MWSTGSACCRDSRHSTRRSIQPDDLFKVVGPSNSVGYVPLVPVAGQLKIPSIGTGSGAPVKEWNPYAVQRKDDPKG